jgi:hypothetical protein
MSSTATQPRTSGALAAVERRLGRARLDLSRPGLAPLLCVSLLAIVTLAVFARHLFGHWIFPWDFVGAYSATPPFVAATVGGGHFVTWSPFVASGFPVAVNLQAEMYFPVWWLFGVLGVPLNLTALTAIQVAHVLGGALGVLALARVRGLEWRWALIAGLAYLFFGGFYGEAEHSDILRGFAYLPWLLWALTPPPAGQRWSRLIALPLIAWLIVGGAYPGQVVSFSLIALVYLGVALRGGLWREHRLALAGAVAASGAIVLAVMLPYLLAQGHQLIRIGPPTAAVRAERSFGPLDLFGLYLNNWAWTHDGSVNTWGIGVPVIVGALLARRPAFRRQLPLVAAGLFAFLLASTPKIGPIGKAMVALGPLFPSRFPAADYKAAVIIALVIVAVEGWRSLSLRPPATRRWIAIVTAAVLVLGALLMPSDDGSVTRWWWLLGITIAGTSALVLLRPKLQVLTLCLLALVALDGVRQIRDYGIRRISSWQAPPSAAAFYRARDPYISRLPQLLSATPTTRPERIAPFLPYAKHQGGSDPDAFGWVAAGYHLIDYGGTVERPLWQALHDPAFYKLMLAPWQAFVWPCPQSGCTSGAIRLPPAAGWRPSPAVTTTAYGLGGVTYRVSVRQPSLMVENELPIKGWRSDSSRATLVDAGVPLRAWRLAPGSYTFTATFHQPGARIQDAAAVFAAIAWIGVIVVLRRRRAT